MHLVIEIAGNDFNLPRIVIEMSRLAGDFKVPATGEVASDIFLFDDALNGIDGLKRGGVHAPREFASIHRNEFVDTQFQSRKHHAAVTRTRTPANSLRFEHDDFRAALG